MVLPTRPFGATNREVQVNPVELAQSVAAWAAVRIVLPRRRAQFASLTAARAISYPVRMPRPGLAVTRFLARRLLNYVVLLALASFLTFA